MKRCSKEQACTLIFTSFAQARWEFDPTSPDLPCSLWLNQAGAWVHKAPAKGLLELWLGSSAPHCRQASPRGQTPRWLLLDQPVESAQSGGMGTRRPRFTFSRQSPAVKSALIQGEVDGVLSLGHGETELLVDLERATIRSGRQWLKRAVFSIIFGQNPKLGPAPWGFAARSHRPEFWSKKNELQLEVRGLRQNKDKITLQIHDQVRQFSVELPRFAPRHTVLRARAHVEPCLDCAARRDAPEN